MSADPTLDPDLEQVLEDIAADPRAKLFATDPRKILTGLQDGSLQTPASRTGLRPAERHLLEVYRHELAFLLRQVYRAELAKRNTVHVQLTPVSESKLRTRVASLLRACGKRTSETEQLEAFSKGSTLDLQRVLGASLVTETAPQALVCLGNQYFDQRLLLSAGRLFSLVLRQKQDLTSQYCSWEGLALVREEKGDRLRSMEAYCKARDVALQVSTSDALTSTSNILRLALISNAQKQATEAAVWIDRHFDQDSEVLAENVRALNALSGEPDLAKTGLVQSLLQLSEFSAREVIHAIAG